MICFSTHSALIISDLVNPNDVVSSFYYINFLKFLNLAMQNSFSVTDSANIGNLIKRNHEMFREIFEKNIKPKQHYMFHYWRRINLVGPLKKIWVMKNEMYLYHRQFKRYANVSCNRQNLQLSIITKEWQKLAYQLYNQNGYDLNYFSKIIYFI